MIVNAYKTHKITVGENLYEIFDKYLPKLEEKGVVVITSKIVSICQGNVVKNDGKQTKHELAKIEAQYYLGDKYPTPYGHLITVKDNILIPSAGIDESNADGNFILYPKDLQKTTNTIWNYLRQKLGLQNLGVIISDSHTTPMRWGVTGIGLSWCGFKPLKNYINQPDIFGRKLISTQQSILDGLACSAVLVMGEGNEQQPLAVVKDIPFVEFQTRPPTQKEIDAFKIEMAEDIYGPLFTSIKWEKGGEKL